MLSSHGIFSVLNRVAADPARVNGWGVWLWTAAMIGW